MYEAGLDPNTSNAVIKALIDESRDTFSQPYDESWTNLPKALLKVCSQEAVMKHLLEDTLKSLQREICLRVSLPQLKET
jgi:hypothetical protein